MRRIRFTLRKAMILVALVGVIVGPGLRYAQTLRQRRQEYAFAAQTSDMVGQLHQFRAKARHISDAERQYARTAAWWHAARSAKYKRAASRPWIVVRDEPEPAAPALTFVPENGNGMFPPPDPALMRERLDRARAAGAARAHRDVIEVVERLHREARQHRSAP